MACVPGLIALNKMKTTIETKSNPLLTSLVGFLSAPILGALLLGLGISNVWSQGQVNFDTKAVGARCTCIEQGLAGAAWFARLYAAAGTGAARGALAPVGIPVNFRTGVNAGYVQTSGVTSKGQEVNPVVTVTTLAGGPVTV